MENKELDAILINGKPYFIESCLGGYVGSFQSLSSRIIDANRVNKFNRKDGFTNIELVKNYVKKYF